MTVLIQAGHQNIASNCDWGLRGETGAPGEVEYVSQVAAIVCGALAANGVSVQGVDANANCNGQVTGRDYAAVVALHCDGRDTSGFAVGVGNPTEDGAAEASQKLETSLRSAYAAANPSLPDLSAEFVNDPNISEYYLFTVLTPATPFALIELGAIAALDGSGGPDKLYLTSEQHNVANGVVRGVLAFLGLDPTPSAPATITAPVETPEPASVDVGPPGSTSIGNVPIEPTPAPVPQFDEITMKPLVGPPPALVPDNNSIVLSIKNHLSQIGDLLGKLIGD